MKNTIRQITAITALSTLLVTNPVYAQGPSGNFSQSIEHSVQAVGHSAVAGAQLTSGILAVPLLIGGAVGEVSQAAGESLWEVASTPVGDPLPVSDEHFITSPNPSRAMNREEM